MPLFDPLARFILGKGGDRILLTTIVLAPIVSTLSLVVAFNRSVGEPGRVGSAVSCGLRTAVKFVILLALLLFVRVLFSAAYPNLP